MIMIWRCIHSPLSGIFISSTRMHVLMQHLLETRFRRDLSVVLTRISQNSARVKHRSASSQHNFDFSLLELERLGVQNPAFG